MVIGLLAGNLLPFYPSFMINRLKYVSDFIHLHTLPHKQGHFNTPLIPRVVNETP